MKINLNFWQKTFLSLTLLVLLTGSWYYFLFYRDESNFTKKYASLQLINTNIGKENFSLLVASTPKSQEIGLSNLKSLPKNYGMLFQFEKSEFHSFWMKDTLIPLDIIFLQDSKIVTIIPNLSPQTYPQTYTSNLPANNVIEINAGESSRLNLKVGDQILIPK